MTASQKSTTIAAVEDEEDTQVVTSAEAVAVAEAVLVPISVVAVVDAAVGSSGAGVAASVVALPAVSRHRKVDI